MPAAPNGVLARMLERLFAAIVAGPCINCRPQSSRQRLDLTALSALGDLSPEQILAALLSDEAEARVRARVPRPPDRAKADPSDTDPATGEVGTGADSTEATQPFLRQQRVLQKVRVIADEAREYENDTGVHVLALGYPLISIPPGAGPGSASRRVLAPVAMIPLTIEVAAGATPSITLGCRAADADRVQPNEALLAWIEQQTGRKPAEVFADPDGADPCREISELTAFVCGALGLETPEALFPGPGGSSLEPAPIAEQQDRDPRARILTSAVLGLFPLANQGLLRDTRAMLGAEPVEGPVESFLRAGSALEEARAGDAPAPDAGAAMPGGACARSLEDERLVTPADPFQARAVRLARSCPALVIHGPPGTGKSQTITNIIGDHLSRGQRVLFVCDKRTALDVVADRLEALGLGSLCAVVHDPQRDPRDLFKAIRDQVESLVETHPPTAAEGEIAKVDAELSRLQAELASCWRGLMAPDPGGGPSLHELVGQWMAAGGPEEPAGASTDGDGPEDGVTLAAFEAATLEITHGLERAASINLPDNPWSRASGLSLDELLGTAMPPLREALRACAAAGAEADRVLIAGAPAFAPGADLAAQAARRAELGELLATAASASPSRRSLWARLEPARATAAARALSEARPYFDLIAAGTPDPELGMVSRILPTPLTPATVAGQIGSLERYLPTARSLLGRLAFGARRAAAAALALYGLSLSAELAERLLTFLRQVRAAMLVQEVLVPLEAGSAPPGPPGPPDISSLIEAYREHAALAQVRTLAAEDPARDTLAPRLREALTGNGGAELVALLKQAPERAAALDRLERAAGACRLLSPGWVEARAAAWRRGERAGEELRRLVETLPTLEDVLRCSRLVERLGGGLGSLLHREMNTPGEPAEGLRRLRRRVLHAEIRRRLAADQAARTLDGKRVESIFDRFERLESAKLGLVRDLARARWITRHRQRLLAGTGSRLNALGAAVKQRLVVRGARALKLRQVIALGREVEGGDPLLDLRPVWMASPETVAQVFPRTSVFDVVIFDEASQCRLEEALPVLTRARRVVIAGDPKQLPPTRFFESGVAASDADAIETEQDLFESQQSQVEDLLGAALNLDVQQCYLDVHYRSRNADLIAFSNEMFYTSRLVSIPGHPRNKPVVPPLTLVRVAGVYHQRTNRVEAERVVEVVRGLLRRAEPPSIGIACFNIAQRDLINEALGQAALDDPDFAARLASARNRRGHAGFEGLFVKNLENVQGDERDHIIVSTTYGPDKAGRFYRRFGPLGMPGGGRRLNVLITRARHEVHLVTSIPPEVYRSLPPVPAGQAPTGGWLLLSYLGFAERLADLYKEAREAERDAESIGTERIAPPTSTELPVRIPAPVRVGQTQHPSALAAELARALAERHGLGSEVFWGNDGFSIDAALDHPSRRGDVTLGVLCDFARFRQAEDPVEWDMFRTRVLRSQGWTLHRVWSPTLVRDAEERLQELAARAHEEAAAADDPAALRVEPAAPPS